MPARPRKTVIVTGGAGFLGSHLCDRLLGNGHHVLCVDNFYSGTKDKVLHLLDHHRFELLRHDVTVPLFVEGEEIYNLACPASPVHYQFDPVQTVKTNVHGAINVLGLAHRTKAKVFQASTNEVYGDPQVHPQVESYWGHVNPIGPRACYDEGKRCAETLFFDYHRRHQVRSFCYVSDLVEAFVRLMDTPGDLTGPVNLGNPVEHTVLQLAQKIIGLTGSRSGIVHKPLPVNDPVRRKTDITQAKAVLGWEPEVDIDQGLMATVEYFEQVLREPTV